VQYGHLDGYFGSESNSGYESVQYGHFNGYFSITFKWEFEYNSSFTSVRDGYFEYSFSPTGVQETKA